MLLALGRLHLVPRVGASKMRVQSLVPRCYSRHHPPLLRQAPESDEGQAAALTPPSVLSLPEVSLSPEARAEADGLAEPLR